MLQAGYTKFVGFDNTASWFESMGFPLPVLSVFLVALAEFAGGILLVLGWLTRLVCIPLMIAMLVAAFAVHGENGWLTLSDGNSWLANERVIEAQEKKQEIRRIMREHGDYRWLTSSGSMTILNNGMQLAITYFLFLLVLLFTGGGRYTSLDYWLGNWLRPKVGVPSD
ncbi:MAG: DoxX family membrane protein [Gammaproteobacteria bacterium]|nr:DoxX family membrane protein [Gammaproteobacteria bacterium]